MATRLIDTIHKIENEEEKLKKFKKQRKTIRTQITNVNKRVTQEHFDVAEATLRLENLNELSCKFEAIQDQIELLMEEENTEPEIVYREEVENMLIAIKLKLMDISNTAPLEKSDSNSSTQQHQQQLGSPVTTSNLSFMPYDERETFQNFTKRLETFMSLRVITDQKQRTLTFLHALTPMIHQRLYDICAPEDPVKKSYEELVKILQHYLDPQASTLALQHKFVLREQHNGESVADFASDLKKLSTNCNFNCACGKSVSDIFLRLQFIRGLIDTEIRTRLLQDREVKSFAEVVDTATAIELSKVESAMISRDNTTQNLNQVKIKKPSQRLQRTTFEGKGWHNSTNSSNGFQRFDDLRGKCFRCGDESHRANFCKFKTETCRSCNKIGHIARVCMSRNHVKQPVNYTERDTVQDEMDNLHEIHLLSNSRRSDKFNATVLVEGKEITFELDTGASLSSISLTEFSNLFPNRQLLPTAVELRTYTGEIIKPRGVALVNCNYKGQFFLGKLYVIDHQVDAIFGRDWMREVKIDWADVRVVEQVRGSKLTSLLKEFEDIFNPGIGVIPDYEAKLQIKENTVPIYVRPRQVPYAIKTKVEKELERLENEQIITKVENSPWGTPVVPVVKPNGNIRLCADYKVTLNKVIKEVNYPIPRIEDIFSNMCGGQYFCTLDISNAYLHMKMDDESAEMQTLSTHKGLYKVNRLMFGVKVAPSLWQRFMDSTLQGIDGVQCFFDDILVQGATFDETFTRLKTVLEVLRSKNLRLNRDKCKFFEKSIKYLGHVIDGNGLHKSSEKVEAIKNAKRPSNVNELRSFLGLATYYSKFISNFSDIVFPLNSLLQKNARFKWTPECDKSFEKVKAEIANETTLAHFDPTLPLVLATDASPVGLGAVISHRMSDGTEKPIAFASRTLTKSERRYSQIDKEATAIYWGLKKFFPYCYGRKFILVTDHKPLVSIFDPHRTLPTITATRIFNYAHFLSGFNYTVEFRRTQEHLNADFLSRFPVEVTPENLIDDVSSYQLHQLESMPVTKEDIAKESVKDGLVNKIIQLLKDGQSLEKVGLNDNEYTLQDECLLKGNRVVIPVSLQKRVLQELHIGHLGIVKMKGLARSYCYWKGIDRDIENLSKTCKECCLKQNTPSAVSVHPWESVEQPWQRIHIDFAGPCLGKNYYFIVVDSFTKWVEIIPTKTTTSDWCITKLRTLFATFGFPIVLVSDNGPQFTSHAFTNFLKTNKIVHKTCAPFNPSSNGQVERFVQTVKKGLIAMKDEKGDMEMKIQMFLMQLRKATNSTGESAYKLMFGRNIRTRLDLLIESSPPQKQEEIKDENKRRREFKIGDRIQALCYNSRGNKWSFGRVLARQGNVMYLLQMDNGCKWRRHVNQMLPCKFEGED